MSRDLEAMAEMRGTCDAIIYATQPWMVRFTDMQDGLTTLIEQHLEMRDFARRRRIKAAEYYGLVADALEKARSAMTAAASDAEGLIGTLENTIARLNAAGAAVSLDLDLSPDETTHENL